VPKAEVEFIYSISLSTRATRVAGTSTPIAFCGLEIDNQLEPVRLLHRDVGRLGAAKHSRRNFRPLTIKITHACAIAGQRTRFRGFWKLEDGGQA
jgi:hypothetical protein